jgi:hypothetical protein
MSSGEYSVSVSSNDIKEAISGTASALYSLIEEALAAQEQRAEDDYDFELFARDILGVLVRHAEQLNRAEAAWDQENASPDDFGESLNEEAEAEA